MNTAPQPTPRTELRKLREACRFTREQAAGLGGVTWKCISDWENGLGGYASTSKEKIARYCRSLHKAALELGLPDVPPVSDLAPGVFVLLPEAA